MAINTPLKRRHILNIGIHLLQDKPLNAALRLTKCCCRISILFIILYSPSLTQSNFHIFLIMVLILQGRFFFIIQKFSTENALKEIINISTSKDSTYTFSFQNAFYNLNNTILFIFYSKLISIKKKKFTKKNNDNGKITQYVQILVSACNLSDFAGIEHLYVTCII